MSAYDAINRGQGMIKGRCFEGIHFEQQEVEGEQMELGAFACQHAMGSMWRRAVLMFE